MDVTVKAGCKNHGQSKNTSPDVKQDSGVYFKTGKVGEMYGNYTCG